MTTSARVAIRRVRFKAGGELHLLKDGRDEARARVERDVRACLDSAPDLAGFAFVTWSKDLSTCASHWSGPHSVIPHILIPDFVRTRLLAMQIERWTLETINERNGFPSDPAS